LKRCKMRRRIIVIEFSGPDVIFNRLFRVVYLKVQLCICSNDYINRDKTTNLYS